MPSDDLLKAKNALAGVMESSFLKCRGEIIGNN